MKQSNLIVSPNIPFFSILKYEADPTIHQKRESEKVHLPEGYFEVLSVTNILKTLLSERKKWELPKFP